MEILKPDTRVLYFIVPTEQVPFMERGWGNGYCILPPGHKFHGKDMSELDSLSVHCGITYTKYMSAELVDFYKEYAIGISGILDESFIGCWLVGFDTGHSRDNPKDCDQKYVLNQTLKLWKQLMGKI